MRRFLFCLVIAGLAFHGCSVQKPPDSETRLFQDFSLGKIVERVHSPELCGSSGSSGYTSLPGTSRRRDFSLIYVIEEGEGARFDEVSFIMKLKAESERAADDAGVRRGGGGLSGDAFNFDYSNEDHEGSLEVIGTRVEGNQYKLWGVIREKTKTAKQ